MGTLSVTKVQVKMAGRGRGRGRGGLSFNTEALHIQRGDIISNPGLQPAPLFPPLVHKPIPLMDSTSSEKALIELKQEFQDRFQQSPFYMILDEKRHDIERYSDKYQPNHQEQNKQWTPDWNLFPAELKPKKRRAQGSARPNVKAARTRGTAEDVLSKLESLEKSAPVENAADEERDDEDEEKEGGEQEGEEEEEYEDEEEETDYNLTYFDNGENYGDDDDEEDEPVYS